MVVPPRYVRKAPFVVTSSSIGAERPVVGVANSCAVTCHMALRLTLAPFGKPRRFRDCVRLDRRDERSQI